MVVHHSHVFSLASIAAKEFFMKIPLSVRLRQGTQESHYAAEHSPFIQNFFAGQLSKTSYREFLVQLLYIYAELEKQQERHREHSVFKHIYFPELNRCEALIHDLSFYYEGGHWQTVSPLPATQNYVERIHALAERWIEGLVAHHYTRYLGDLSGGQALKRIVAKTYGLLDGHGLAFYDFAQIDDYSAFKIKYRAQLDAMPVDDEIAQKIVDEANRVFDLNRELFDSMMDRLS